MNRAAVDEGRQRWLNYLHAYRTHSRTEALQKHGTLSYDFHISVYCRPHMRYLDLHGVLRKTDGNPAVLGLPETARSGMIYLFERLQVANQSVIHRWW